MASPDYALGIIGIALLAKSVRFPKLVTFMRHVPYEFFVSRQRLVSVTLVGLVSEVLRQAVYDRGLLLMAVTKEAKEIGLPAGNRGVEPPDLPNYTSRVWELVFTNLFIFDFFDVEFHAFSLIVKAAHERQPRFGYSQSSSSAISDVARRNSSSCTCCASCGKYEIVFSPPSLCIFKSGFSAFTIARQLATLTRPLRQEQLISYAHKAFVASSNTEY